MIREEFFDRIAIHRPELARAGVRRLGIFGSVIRSEAGPESDVDILVEFEKMPDLYEFAALRERTASGVKVAMTSMPAQLP